MALLINDNAVYLHIPKTGGTWFRHAMQASGIRYTEIGEQHNHFPLISDFMPPRFYDDKFIFTFVRHPLTWYQSRWAFRVQHGWHMDHPFDFNCASNDFHDFLQRVLLFQPTGWLNYIYGLYIDNTPHQIDYVGRIETLVDDAVGILKTIGVRFDERKFRATPRVNESVLDGRTSGYWAKYTPELLKRILDAEKTVLSRFYTHNFIDLDKFLC